MNVLVLKSIYDKILELSDGKLQRKLWLSEDNNTALISSYTELMCMLFDDYNFDDFVDSTAKSFGVQEFIIYELSKLRDELNDYKEKGNDMEIINEPKWQKITQHSKKIVS